MQNSCILNEENSILVCEDFGHFKEYEDGLFEIFLSKYENGAIVYNGLPVRMKHYPPNYGPRSGFYHLICENYDHTQNEEDRVPNPRRCERLKWPETIIMSCGSQCPELLVWENKRHGKENIVLFCPELDYVVILSKRKNYLLLTTAYPVEYNNRRNNLLEEYNKYKQTTHSA